MSHPRPPSKKSLFFIHSPVLRFAFSPLKNIANFLPFRATPRSCNQPRKDNFPSKSPGAHFYRVYEFIDVSRVIDISSLFAYYRINNYAGEKHLVVVFILLLIIKYYVVALSAFQRENSESLLKRALCIHDGVMRSCSIYLASCI